jgi:hypothetical protein
MHIDPAANRSMAETASLATDQPRAKGQPRVRRPWMQLLSSVLGLAGGHGELLRHSERPWASVTFSGTRHTIALAFSGAAAIAAGEAFIEALPEHEFAIPRQIVADAAIVSVVQDVLPLPRMMVEVELLLLEDC